MAPDAGKSDEEELAYRLFEVHDVSLGNDGEDDFNTVVLDGAEVVLPLEMDIDGDPLQDDTVSLRSVHGLFEQTLSARHPDVMADEDNRLFHYRFRHVPAGLYRLAARIGERWVTVTRDVLVSREGVFVGGKKLSDAPPSFKAAEPEEPHHGDPEAQPAGCER